MVENVSIQLNAPPLQIFNHMPLGPLDMIRFFNIYTVKIAKVGSIETIYYNALSFSEG